jgi:mannose-6-phosphate isomerase-like protein (cupin superfamily)
MAFKAVAAQAGGDFSLMERTVPPRGRRPLPHRHVNCSEAFWVLDGTITFVFDGVESRGGPDDFLLVPRGAAHTFGNDGDAPARLLVLHAPGDGRLLHGTRGPVVPPAAPGPRGGARPDGPLRHGTRLLLWIIPNGWLLRLIRSLAAPAG